MPSQTDRNVRLRRRCRRRYRFADNRKCFRSSPRVIGDMILDSCSTANSAYWWTTTVRLLSCAWPVCFGTKFSPASRTAADSWRSLCALTSTNTCCWRILVPIPTADCWWTLSGSFSNFRNLCRSPRCLVVGLPVWHILYGQEKKHKITVFLIFFVSTLHYCTIYKNDHFWIWSRIKLQHAFSKLHDHGDKLHWSGPT